jgi:hypothetical protein
MSAETAGATLNLVSAVGPELVGALGSAAKASFNAVADTVERAVSSSPRIASRPETVPLLSSRQASWASVASASDGSEDGGDEARGFLSDTLGANGRVVAIVETVPIVGQLVAGAQMLAGRRREAKRALAKSTKTTVMGGVAAAAAMTGGALLGAYAAAAGLSSAALGAVGLFGGAMAGSAAGELAGGASQALVEATVYDEADRREIGTQYLTRTPVQWTKGVAVASTVGAVGASVGLQIDQSALAGTLKGSIEQKVVGELTETVAERAIGLRDNCTTITRSSKRSRAAERWRSGWCDSHAAHDDDSDEPEEIGGTGVWAPLPRRQRSGGYGEVHT